MKHIQQKMLILGVVTLFTMTIQVHAQDSTRPLDETSIAHPFQNIKKDLIGKGMEDKNTLKEKRGELKKEIIEHRSETKQAREEIRTAPREDREDMRNNLQEKNTLWRKNMKEKKVEIKATRKEILENRLTSMSERFETLMTRIQSRIDKIKASGRDTTKAQAKLVVAQTTFTEIKKQIANLSAAATGTQTLDQGTLVELKEKMKKLQEQLKEVLKSLEVEKSATSIQ